MSNAAEMFAAVVQAELNDKPDDTLSLAWADALQEEGDDARAELIRVHIRMDEIRRWCGCGSCVNRRGGGQHTNGPCGIDRRQDDGVRLRMRERELLDKHESTWRAVGKCDKCNGTGDITLRSGKISIGDVPLGEIKFARMEMGCPKCSGTGDIGGLLRRGIVHKGSLNVVFKNRVEWLRGLPRAVHAKDLNDMMPIVGDSGWEPVFAVRDWAASVIRNHPSVDMFVAPEFTPYSEFRSKIFAWMPPSEDFEYRPHRLPRNIFTKLLDGLSAQDGELRIYTDRHLAMRDLYRAIYLAARDIVFPNGVPA